MTIREYTDPDWNELMPLYATVGWTNYTDKPGMLRAAYAHSLCILAAYEDDRLLGVVRAVGDGASIVFIQDILVFPKYQRRGIGKALLCAMMERYRTVYQMVGPVTPWGKPTLGYKTRKQNHRTDKQIVRRRNGK